MENYLTVNLKQDQVDEFMKKLSPQEKTEFIIWSQLFNLLNVSLFEDAYKRLQLSKCSTSLFENKVMEVYSVLKGLPTKQAEQILQRVLKTLTVNSTVL